MTAPLSLPPTLVIVDENEAHAARLTEAGAPTTSVRYNGPVNHQPTGQGALIRTLSGVDVPMGSLLSVIAVTVTAKARSAGCNAADTDLKTCLRAGLRPRDRGQQLVQPLRQDLRERETHS
jgi:acetyl esterase/lipase